MIYINIYEEFINSFDKENYDNETFEKYYMHLKQLFEKYAIILKTKEKYDSSIENENYIKDSIKNYINIFILKTSRYLYDLLDILEQCPRKIFFEIVIYAMEQMNISGKNCLEESKTFSKYNWLTFFESSHCLFKKYVNNIPKLSAYFNLYEKCRELLEISLFYINGVKKGSILLLEDSIKQGKLISSVNTKFSKYYSKDEKEENYEIILQNYEKKLREITILYRRNRPHEPYLKEAICIANIVKISHSFLGKMSKRLLDLCEHCEFIANSLGITDDQEWYKEFKSIYIEIKDNYEILEFIEKEMKNDIRQKYKEKFEELENKYNRRKNDEEFIDYILKNYPYKDQENDPNLYKIKSSKDEQETIQYLISKYHPGQYKYSMDDEQSQLNYCLIELIESFLNIIFEDIQFGIRC